MWQDSLVTTEKQIPCDHMRNNTHALFTKAEHMFLFCATHRFQFNLENIRMNTTLYSSWTKFNWLKQGQAKENEEEQWQVS